MLGHARAVARAFPVGVVPYSRYTRAAVPGTDIADDI